MLYIHPLFNRSASVEMAVSAQVLLSGSKRLHRGYHPSVSIHPKKNVAIRVHDSYYGGNLYYSVGEVHKQEVLTGWGDPILYGRGTNPSIALTEVEEQLYVIETHGSRAGRDCYYMVGKVNQDDRTIEWGPENSYCSGLRPRVCVNSSNTVIFIKEKPWGLSSGLKYHIGKVNTSKTIEWKPGNQCISVTIEGTFVSQPAIAISGNMVVLMYRCYRSTLKCMIATLDGDNNIGSWTPLAKLQGGGINPSVSINSKGHIIESHQTKTLRRIYCSAGKINGRNIEWNPNSVLPHTMGEYPSISLADDDHIIEVHKTNYGHDLFSSQGTLRTKKGDLSDPNSQEPQVAPATVPNNPLENTTDKVEDTDKNIISSNEL